MSSTSPCRLALLLYGAQLPRPANAIAVLGLRLTGFGRRLKGEPGILLNGSWWSCRCRH